MKKGNQLVATGEFITTYARQLEAQQEGRGYQLLVESFPTATGEQISKVIKGKAEFYTNEKKQTIHYKEVEQLG